MIFASIDAKRVSDGNEGSDLCEVSTNSQLFINNLKNV